jgi:organic anion transporter 4A
MEGKEDTAPLAPPSPVDGKGGDVDDTVPLGCFGAHPKWLQRFGSPKWYLSASCVFVFLLSLAQVGFLPVGISSIEKRFSLSSTKSGVLSGAYDGAILLTVIFITHYGHNSHRPRWLCVGLLLFGFCQLLFALPHLLAGTWHTDERSGKDLCSTTNPTVTCTTGDEQYYGVFLTAQALSGVVSAPVYTLGTTFLDDNMPVGKNDFYIAIYNAVSVFGPAVG